VAHKASLCSATETTDNSLQRISETLSLAVFMALDLIIAYIERNADNSLEELQAFKLST
jgi:hypothetical protein